MFYEEISWREPIDAFASFVGEASAHLFHAGALAHARWSFIVCDPIGQVQLPGERPASGARVAARAAFDDVERRVGVLARSARPSELSAAPFLSGAAGFIGYETGGWLEPAAAGPDAGCDLPSMSFHLYDGAVVFDRAAQRAFLCFLDENKLRRVADRIAHVERRSERPAQGRALTSNFTEDRYKKAVQDVIDRILRGDIFQANIAQTLKAELEKEGDFSLFKALSGASDAPFGAFLQYAEGNILSNSPERFFRVVSRNGDKAIICEPIKGTRVRGATPPEDKKNATLLLESEKDRAENIMIADLIRNDLSIVCEDASIKEDALCELQSFASVHHLVSRLSGVLEPDVSSHTIERSLR
ncbi:MAG: chorismate-binding protein, partial [Pseudomonadota bacterium]